ncbi:hypothetical protein [Ilumatobacter sp.]|uniref:hypothetical protein n=1 Tax=Ilumatobacter sp. TaxID=1967498 RepID=UPI003C3A111D
MSPDARRGAENVLYSIAAGFAMAFAIAAALIYGTPNGATDLWVCGAASLCWRTSARTGSRPVTLADPDSGILVKSSLPRAYDVTILHPLAPPGTETAWSAARVVSSRKGIRRDDQHEA